MSAKNKIESSSVDDSRMNSAAVEGGADVETMVMEVAASPEHGPGRSDLRKKSLWNGKIIRQALVDSVRKLDPRWMVKNPVMFVVEVGSVLTSALLIDNVMHHRAGFGFNLQITLWLWFTVLFANFAEAMAEGRGKAQADTLRKAKGETIAQR